MNITTKARIIGETPCGKLLLEADPPEPKYIIEHQEISEISVIFEDGRVITTSQRRMIYAIIGAIQDWSGHNPDELKYYFKLEYVKKTGGQYFSLRDTDMTTANVFLEMLIDFCLKWGVPTKFPLREYAPEIEKYVYACLMNKKCAVCGAAEVDLHHFDTIGIGGNRLIVNHAGRKVMSLCRLHHTEVHTIGFDTFLKKYYLSPVKCDKSIAKVYGLNYF